MNLIISLPFSNGLLYLGIPSSITHFMSPVQKSVDHTLLMPLCDSKLVKMFEDNTLADLYHHLLDDSTV